MSVIEQIGNDVVVNGWFFIKHDYYLHRVPQLVEALHRSNLSNKNLKIIFSDGEPIRYTGIEHLLSIISLELNLVPTKLIVQTTDRDFKSAYATVQYLHSPFFRNCAQAMSNWTEQSTDKDAVLFGATFGRYTLERFLLAAFLDTEHSDKSFVVFQPPSDVIEFEFNGLEEKFKQELDWYKNYQRHEYSLPSEHNGLVNWRVGCNDYKTVWPKYLIEIVAETDCHCKTWITEKTIRCLITGKPFIAMAGLGFLKWLQDLGFKTYDHLINESYDSEPRTTVRLAMIKEEINKIASLTPEKLATLMQELNLIAMHNKQQLSKITKEYYDNTTI